MDEAACNQQQETVIRLITENKVVACGVHLFGSAQITRILQGSSSSLNHDLSPKKEGILSGVQNMW